ncbi:MerR family transcriptional regulator [Candidatus Stoquefichus massiliensis]|uniref:MerR family transcriptional regulator n=1 Tax=Candidatus Stoquefichus massiliensis TaxID=1470350 RepID=UPI000485DC74|nr:MerR family transcriptional regulator [Candidatus Stoquefichus massiliensis]
MKINEVAHMYNMTQDTLRYYEKIGLLDPVLKDKCGNRDYRSQDLKRLEFIRCMRDAGLSIQVLQKYIQLYNQGDKTVEERKKLLIQQKEELMKKKECIQVSIDKLNHKIENYEKLLKE